ncbi:hypothetical protein MNBD_BACTEROID05-49, partial [hydrothermal vent metagenome]
MNKKIIIVVVIVAIVIIWVGHALFNIQPKPSGLKVGVIAGLSGEYAFVGENYRKGIMLAYELYQKENPESATEITIEDDEFDAKKGLSAYKKLMEINKVDALINMTSPTINAIYDTVVKIDMPVIQLGEQGQAPSDDNVFQISPGNVSEELGEYTKNLDLDNVAVVYSNDLTFIRFFEAFRKGYGGSFDEYKINIEEKDYKTIVSKILNKKPSAIVFMTIPEQGARVAQEILKLSKDKPMFIFDASFQIGFNDYERILGDLTVLDGDVVMVITQTTSDEFTQLYKEKYGEDPGFVADWAYDSFNLLIRTYDSNGEKWISNIKKAN